MNVQGTFNSVWDGGYTIETFCTVNLNTGLIKTKAVDADDVEVLDREYVEIANTEFEVEETDGEYQVKDLKALKKLVVSQCLTN